MSSLLLVPWRGRKSLPESDALLLHAYSLYKASLCPCGCGFPKAMTLDPDADGSVEVDDSQVCEVRRALDEWRTQSDPQPGVLPVPVLDEKSYQISKARSAARASGSS